MMSDKSRLLFVQRLRAGLDPHNSEGDNFQPPPLPEPRPVSRPTVTDGYEVCELESIVQLSEEDQKLLIDLRERHEMYKKRHEVVVDPVINKLMKEVG